MDFSIFELVALRFKYRGGSLSIFCCVAVCVIMSIFCCVAVCVIMSIFCCVAVCVIMSFFCCVAVCVIICVFSLWCHPLFDRLKLWHLLLILTCFFGMDFAAVMRLRSR